MRAVVESIIATFEGGGRLLRTYPTSPVKPPTIPSSHLPTKPVRHLQQQDPIEALRERIRQPHLRTPHTPRQQYLLAQPLAPGQSQTPALLSEAQRLNDQHYAYRRASKNYLLHPDLQPQRFGKILDVGCGTGIWLRDFANSSFVQMPRSIHLHGCDLDTRMARMMPSDGLTVTPEVFKHDVTASAVSMKTQCHGVGVAGSYDLVHARLLVFALKKGEAGWQKAVRNMSAFLKPGGILHLSDLNAVGYTYGSAISGRTSSNIEALNRISRRALSFVNNDLHAGDHLEAYLAGASLHNIASQRFCIPFGRAAKDQGWSEEEVERGDQTALKAFVGLKRPFLAAGGDPGRNGIGTTSDDFDAFLSRLKEEIRHEGMLFEFVMAYGQKL